MWHEMNKVIIFILLFLVLYVDSERKPLTSEWIKNYMDENTTNFRPALANWLISGCWLNYIECTDTVNSTKAEFPPYDGWYNNIDRPDSGAIDGHLLRRWPASYEDGTYSPSGSSRPNPFILSDNLLNGSIGSQSRTGKTALLVFFGQQVVEEILDAQRPACPPEYFNIPIPVNHKYRKQSKHSNMPFLRTRYDQRTGHSPNNPRQQLNEITPYIDGGLMYGITKQWSDVLRTYDDGTIDPDGLLAHSHDGLFPEYNTHRLPLANPPPPFYHADFINNHETAKVSRFFKLGNPRGNENTFLLTFGILWFRWHNYLARGIKRQHGNWSSDKVFNEARKWVIATQQHIVIDEWLPAWIKTPIKPYTGYDPTVNPQIDQFFQAAAFRFGHTLVPPGVYLRDYARNNCTTNFANWNKAAVRTCNSYWRPQDALKTLAKEGEFIDIDRILMGSAYQLCEEEDHKIVEDLRGNVFGPLEFPRRDLMAINIQRARDHGLPDFNTARLAYGLKPVTNFNYFSASEEIRIKMRQLYNDSLDNIDPWVGGILETGDGPGELFETVILDQFRRIRDGDRFWYNNTNNKLFTLEEIDRIKAITLYDIIMAVTKMDPVDIQTNPFRVPSNTSEFHQTCNLIKSECRMKDEPATDCYHLKQLNDNELNEPCIQGTTYDYFSGSRLSYILSFVGIGTFVVGIIGMVYILFVLKQKETAAEALVVPEDARKSLNLAGRSRGTEQVYTACEWLGSKETARPVIIKLIIEKQQIGIFSYNGALLRIIDLRNRNKTLSIFKSNNGRHILVKLINDYDMILQFDSNYLQETFSSALKDFLSELSIQTTTEQISHSNLLKCAVTYVNRKDQLDTFFRVIFAQAFGIKHSTKELLSMDADKARILAHTEITLREFADVLGMRPEAEFVQKMFHLVDKDKSNSISYREFTDLLVIFANGDEERKAKLLFDMYDINAVGYLTGEDFTVMIKSFLETVGGTVRESDLNITIKDMLHAAGLQNKVKLDFADFKKIVGDDIKKLNKATIGLKGVQQNYIDKARETIENIYETSHDIRERIQGINAIDKMEKDMIVEKRQINHDKLSVLFQSIEKNAATLFWQSLYTLVLLAIFAERAYYYSVETEHSGLRRIAGYGVTVTRGAASGMMFTYSSLLVTMCRNTISYLRETSISNYFPFDSMTDFHKYIAVWSLVFTLIHIIGHGFNFYHISTQTSDDLTCLFRNYFHATHEFPKFHYWCWQTMTGLTGVILTLMAALIFIFAHHKVRQNLYNWFRYTHSLYPLFYIFMFLHGAGRLIQEPFFHYFFLGPLVLYIIDTVISVKRKKIQIPVLNALILPSNVTMLKFKRPENFEYKSGQWIRIACLELSPNEYHPFTLSSSPDESNLTVHIRAVGPWTRLIRKIYGQAVLLNKPLPLIYLDGPYGETHQDWYQYEVSVLVGGGIGVTPFASILKDIVFKANTNYKLNCKKVYFIWSSKTQKEFEWLVDIIREVEEIDKNSIVTCHIFITQFYHKFDLRTILLYICERHYQKISQKSLFTNLQAVTHFGRANFTELFKTLQSIHNNVSKVGVLSCGPPSMTNAIETACYGVNNIAKKPIFYHHFKNF